MAKRHEAPFTNEFGHMINPGDKVIVVVQGFQHSIKAYKAVYIGYVTRWHRRKVSQFAQVKTFDSGWRLPLQVARIATLQNNLIFPEPKEETNANL